MKKIALVFFISSIFFSCEKDKGLSPENIDIPLLSKVLIAGEPFMVYSYTNANLISEEKNKFHYTNHTYNDRNLLISSDFYIDEAIFSSSFSVLQTALNRKAWVSPANTGKSLTKTYEYNGKDQLIRITYNRPSINNSEYSEFTYENDRINRHNMYWQNVLSSYIDYNYDENGNLIKELKYHFSLPGNAELWTTTEYEYDNMQNPFRSFKRLVTPGFNTNRNNITKETYTIHFEVDQWTQKVQITNNSYEYNDQGYPVKVNGEAEYVYR